MIDRGYLLPSGEYRLFVNNAWVQGKLSANSVKADAIAALVVSTGYDLPAPAGWELRGETDSDGWAITGPATQGG